MVQETCCVVLIERVHVVSSLLRPLQDSPACPTAIPPRPLPQRLCMTAVCSMLCRGPESSPARAYQARREAQYALASASSWSKRE